MPLIYMTLLDDFDVIPMYSFICFLGMLVQTSMSCMHKRGQTCWQMFAISIGMNKRI
jgi:hypothetical protein